MGEILTMGLLSYLKVKANDTNDNCSYVELHLTVDWNMILLLFASSDMRLENAWTYHQNVGLIPDSPSSALRITETGRG